MTRFDKLSRARSQRDQYLVIQALTLTVRVPSATLELVDIYFDTRKDDFEDGRALLARAEAYLSMEKLPEAIQSYKDVLAREAEFPRYRTRTYLDLPYLIASRGVASEYEFALSVLADGLDDKAFPRDVFLWRAANALIASEQGRRDDSADHAKKAIEVAGENGRVAKAGLWPNADRQIYGVNVCFFN